MHACLQAVGSTCKVHNQCHATRWAVWTHYRVCRQIEVLFLMLLFVWRMDLVNDPAM